MKLLKKLTIKELEEIDELGLYGIIIYCIACYIHHRITNLSEN